MGLRNEERDSARVSTALVYGWMKTQAKKAKQIRGTAKGKLTREPEKYHEHLKYKLTLEVLEDNYNLIVKAFKIVELSY